jgi:hypothetical protein
VAVRDGQGVACGGGHGEGQWWHTVEGGGGLLWRANAVGEGGGGIRKDEFE